jgi:hypothetical protein
LQETKKPLGFLSIRNSRGVNGFGQDRLTKKETAFRLSLWCARRDLNSRLPEHMELSKLLFALNARLVSNIPIFPSDIFTLILLRVPVRVKMVCLFSLAKQSHKIPSFPTSTFYHRTYSGFLK